MTKTTRRVAGAVVVVTSLMWTSHAIAKESSAAVASQLSRRAPDARVRGVGAKVVAIINQAAAQSQTFRGLVDQINCFRPLPSFMSRSDLRQGSRSPGMAVVAAEKAEDKGSPV